MAKLRLRLGALRRIIGELDVFLESDDREAKIKELKARIAEIEATQRQAREAELQSIAKRNAEVAWSQDPARDKRYMDVLSKNPRASISPDETVIKGPGYGPGPKIPSPRGSRPEPTKPGYDPQLPRIKGQDPEWLSVHDPQAHDAWEKMGSPQGEIYTHRGYAMFRPKDPSQRALFWAGVPEKKVWKQGEEPGASKHLVTPREGEMKPHAWRPWEELTQDQRRGLGWVDPRDRGRMGKKEEEEPEEEPLGVRVRGYSNYPLHARDPETGEVISPSEVSMTSHVPGAEPPTPGKGGGLPSREATAAAQRAFAAKRSKLPDWETVSMQDLHSWSDAAKNAYKSSRDSNDLAIFKAVEREINARVAGKQQKRPERPVAATPREPRHTQTPTEKWGPRKRWGDTSKGVEVEKLPPRGTKR